MKKDSRNDIEISIMQYLDKRLILRNKRFGLENPKFSFSNFTDTAKFEIELIRSFISPEFNPLIPTQYGIEGEFNKLLEIKPMAPKEEIQKIVEKIFPEFFIDIQEFVVFVPENTEKEELTCKNLLSKLLSCKMLYLDEGEIQYELLVNNSFYKEKSTKEIVFFEAILITISKIDLMKYTEKIKENDIIKIQKNISKLEEKNTEKPLNSTENKNFVSLEKCEKILQEIRHNIAEVKNTEIIIENPVESAENSEIFEKNNTFIPDFKETDIISEKRQKSTPQEEQKNTEDIANKAKMILVKNYKNKILELKNFAGKSGINNLLDLKSVGQIEKLCFLLNTKLHQLLIPKDGKTIIISNKDQKLIETIIKYYVSKPEKIEPIGITACGNSTENCHLFSNTIFKQLFHIHSISLSKILETIDPVLIKYLNFCNNSTSPNFKFSSIFLTTFISVFFYIFNHIL